MSLVQFEEVSKVYEVGNVAVRALDRVHLKIEEGEFVAVVGPSGSGKSTLMHLLGFLDQPTSGKITFDGKDISAISPNERATIRSQKIGFVFQAFNLLPRISVLGNTLLPLSYSRAAQRGASNRATEILEQVGMKERANHRPNQLSGGEKQRVAIARALINEPRMILADEPTGNLDSQTAKTIMELFTSLNKQGRTVVIVTHDSDVADYTQRRIRVLDGKVIRV
jgi:ABC-type lipoprotein export system ATPase subunit